MSWQKLQTDLSDTGYVASDDLAMALFLAVTLGKPLLLEGRDPKSVSPLHIDHLPWPITLMHGTDDALVPHEQAVALRDRRLADGLAVDLLSYEGQPHAFFNDATSDICKQATRDLLDALGVTAPG